MCRIILETFILILVAFTSLESFAQTSTTDAGDPAIQKTVETRANEIKKEKRYDNQQKKLVALIDMTNKEFNNYSNIVTDFKSKILEANGNVASDFIAEKDKNELIYNSWATYKVAFEPLYALFVEKNDKYHCDVVSDEIWQQYAPNIATEEKEELDAYTKSAVQISVNIAQQLCKNIPKKDLARTK